MRASLPCKSERLTVSPEMVSRLKSGNVSPYASHSSACAVPAAPSAVCAIGPPVAGLPLVPGPVDERTTSAIRAIIDKSAAKTPNLRRSGITRTDQSCGKLLRLLPRSPALPGPSPGPAFLSGPRVTASHPSSRHHPCPHTAFPALLTPERPRTRTNAKARPPLARFANGSRASFMLLHALDHPGPVFRRKKTTPGPHGLPLVGCMQALLPRSLWSRPNSIWRL